MGVGANCEISNCESLFNVSLNELMMFDRHFVLCFSSRIRHSKLPVRTLLQSEWNLTKLDGLDLTSRSDDTPDIIDLSVV